MPRNVDATIEVYVVGYIGFVEIEREYRVRGYVTKGSHGTYEDPPEPDEVEIYEVELMLLPGEKKGAGSVLLSPEEWPFDDKEIVEAEQKLAEAAFDDSANEDFDNYDD